MAWDFLIHEVYLLKCFDDPAAAGGSQKTKAKQGPVEGALWAPYTAPGVVIPTIQGLFHVYIHRRMQF